MRPLGVSLCLAGPRLDAAGLADHAVSTGDGADLVVGLPAGRLGLNLMEGEEARRRLVGLAAMAAAWRADPEVVARIGRCTTLVGVLADEGIDLRDAWPVIGELLATRDGLLLLVDRLIDASGRVIAAAPDDEDDEEDDLDDEDLDEDPPEPERVLARMRVLQALVERAYLEGAGVPDPERVRARLVAELEATGAWEEAEGDERALLQTPIGELSRQERIDATWRGEGVAVLAWSLGGAPLVAPDEGSDPFRAVRSVPTPPRPRSQEEVEAMRRRLLTVSWRLVEQRVRPGPCDLVGVARRATWGPLTTEGLPLVGGDLAIGGRPVAEADPEQVLFAGSIARERHQAVNWLSGHDPVYSEVATDT